MSKTEINFYHLTKYNLEQALPQLVQKIYEHDKRGLILAKDKPQAKNIDKILWVYDADSFLPHGISDEEHKEDFPILISLDKENYNKATMLVKFENQEIDYLQNFEKVLYIFDGKSDEAVNEARGAWKNYSANENFKLTYWQQNEAGKWDNKKS